MSELTERMERIRKDNFERCVKECTFGIIPTLGELFTEFVYHKSSDRTKADHPAGMYFFSGRGLGIESFDAAKSPGGFGPVLIARPTPAVEQAVLLRSMEGRVGSFELIKGHWAGHALLIGKDSTGIAQVWLAFIPLEGILAINPGNTPTIF